VDEAAVAQALLLQTAQSLRNRTGFHRVDRSFVVEIWFASHDRVLAAEIVNAYADAYIADGITANLAASERTADWMEARLEELRADALAAAQEAERFRLAVGAADQQGLRDLEQRAEALNDLVLRFQSRYRELTLESTYPVSAGRVLSRALPPRDAAAPRAWQYLAGGLLLGLMMGTAVAVLREAREKGFRTSGDVTRTLGLPFVGYVPRPRSRILAALLGRGARTLSAAAARRRPARGALPSRHLADPGQGDASDEALHGTAGNWTFASDLGNPVTARAIRSVFASLDADHDDRTGRLVAVGALGAGEGATHLAAHLGVVAAQAGRRCLLADGDLATGALSRKAGLAGAPGILDVLDGTADLGAALARRPASDLDLLPVGTGRERDAWFSYMAELGEMFVDLRESYDYIFVDLPPLAETPEVKSILRRTDALLLATAWGRTPRKLTRTCLENDPDLRQSVFGVVLTRARIRRLPRYGVPVPYGARRRWWPAL
jgi:Mrp family chromosome partitioning ATPase